MLFDLQSRRRRTVVKIVYLGLAILIGGGLVLFGVGTGTGGGGLFDVFNNDTQDTSAQVSNAEKRAQRAVRVNPQDSAAWADLARARYLRAGQGDNFNETQQTFTAKGQTQLRSAQQAWERYLALRPPRPDANVARLMASAFAALNEPDEAANALEIVTEQDPSSAAYSQLATYAYYASQDRKGDLAAEKAVELAPEQQKRVVRVQLERLKRDIQQQQVQDAIDSGAIRTR
jgi:tetratricopeptide (TPR) repeat protein